MPEQVLTAMVGDSCVDLAVVGVYIFIGAYDFGLGYGTLLCDLGIGGWLDIACEKPGRVV